MAGESTESGAWEGVVSTLDAAPMPMLLIDQSGAITRANPAAAKLIGAPPEELAGTPVEGLVPEGARGRHPTWRADYLKAPASRAMGSGRDLSLARRDGRLVAVEIGLAPIHIDEATYILCSIIDLTERRRAEDERLELTRKAEAERLQSLELMAGGIAHDFNNLLVGVLGNASLLTELLEGDADLTETAEDIEEAAQQAAVLARQMLAFAGGARADTQHTDLRDIVMDFMPLARSLVPRTVELSVPDTAKACSVLVDTKQIRQVLTNLVTNAAAAIDGPGRITVTVSRERVPDTPLVGTRTFGDRFSGAASVLEVSDDGPGIPESSIPRLFDPFYTTKKSGTGIGLAAVLGIAKSHGGFVRVRSVVGEGTAFSLVLPVDATADHDTGDVPAEAAQVPLILVIDDESTVTRFVSRALRASPSEIQALNDPQEGLQLFREHRDRVALVLLDNDMPHMDGHQVLRALRGEAPELPVVLMSGRTVEVPEGLSAHTTRLVKPFTVQELRATVEQALEG